MECTITLKKNSAVSTYTGKDDGGNIDEDLETEAFMNACWAYFDAHKKEFNPDLNVEEDYPYVNVPCCDRELQDFLNAEDRGANIVSIKYK
jgi:hypothetical protein